MIDNYLNSIWNFGNKSEKSGQFLSIEDLSPSYNTHYLFPELAVVFQISSKQVQISRQVY
jgi:hypothetical protein